MIIGDAAFGSFELLKEIKQWGGNGTFSISNNIYPWLWEVLSVNVPPNHWRCATNNNNWIASSHTIIDNTSNKIIHQQILSSAFQVPQQQNQ